MRGIRPIAIIVLLLGSLAACHKSSQTDQLAALNSAYQSGVFTKEEYAAKRAAILGPAATPVTPAPSAPAPAPLPSPPPTAAPATPAPPVVTEAPAKLPPTPVPPPVSQPAAGCEDNSSDSRKLAEDRVFPAPLSRVKAAALVALRELDFNIRADQANEIEATKKRHIGVVVGAGGEKVTLHFFEGQKGTRVTGETRKNFVGRLAQKSWTGAVLAQTGCILREEAR